MPILVEILLATALSSVLSILLAGIISFRFLGRYMPKMICISAGLLLTVAFTHLLPEAFETHSNAASVGWTLLLSVLVLFCLEAYFSSHTPAQLPGSRAGHAILLGDAFHNFTDGVLIASAFMVSNTLGWITAAAIMAHEIPQEVGDFMILLHSGFAKTKALIWNTISGLSSMLGGVAGFFLLDKMQWLMPYAFAAAAASFIYIALSDLMPEIARESRMGVALQLSLILLGVAIAFFVTGGLHVGHAH